MHSNTKKNSFKMRGFLHNWRYRAQSAHFEFGFTIFELTRSAQLWYFFLKIRTGFFFVGWFPHQKPGGRGPKKEARETPQSSKFLCPKLINLMMSGVVLQGGSSSCGSWFGNHSTKKPPRRGGGSFDQPVCVSNVSQVIEVQAVWRHNKNKNKNVSQAWRALLAGY